MSRTATAVSADPKSLAEAFGVFNELSSRLTDAYGQLEARVADLTRELAESRAQREAELNEKELLADQLGVLLEAMPAAIVLVDGRDRVDRYNPAAESLFPSLSWGRRWSEVRDEALLNDHQSPEWQLRDGRNVNVSVRPLNDAGLFLVMVDVTETRRLQEQLHRRERLTAMGEMAAQLAHQIRTPLSAAMLYAGQLARADLGEPPRSFVDKLRGQLRHTERLVADMLAFTRGGRFVPQAVDLVRVIRDASDQVMPRLAPLGAKITVDNPLDEAGVLGNQDALTGAISALLNNALEHGGEDVSIHLRLQETDDDFVLSISDDGPGIPEEIREHIFDPFFTTRERGTGLGLAVVQAVLLEHEGSVEYQPGNQSGVCFEIRLPKGERNMRMEMNES